MQRLAGDRDLQRRLGDAGKALVETRHSPAVVGARYRRRLQALVAAGAGRRENRPDRAALASFGAGSIEAPREGVPGPRRFFVLLWSCALTRKPALQAAGEVRRSCAAGADVAFFLRPFSSDDLDVDADDHPIDRLAELRSG